VVLLSYPSGLLSMLGRRSREASYNLHIAKTLVANGMHSSGEVFCNLWDVYPMTDPQFITFYNYGGWIELDSLYAQERPHPIASTIGEWQEFFAAHHIRFAILRQRGDTRDMFRTPPGSWKELFADARLTVWAIDPPQEPAKQAAATRG
jgi:hypothetical protein